MKMLNCKFIFRPYSHFNGFISNISVSIGQVYSLPLILHWYYLRFVQLYFLYVVVMPNFIL